MTTAGETWWNPGESDELDREIVQERRRTIVRGTKVERAGLRNLPRCRMEVRAHNRTRQCKSASLPGSRYCLRHLGAA